MTRAHQGRRLAAHEPADGRTNSLRPHTYEITFTGQAGPTLRALFDDCEVATGPESTTLTADLSDQAALAGLIQRITSLRLEIILVQLRARPPSRHPEP